MFAILIIGCDSPVQQSLTPDGGEDLSAAVIDDGGFDLARAANTDLARGPCPSEMVHVSDRDAGLDFCVDPYEGYTIDQVTGQLHSPFSVMGDASVVAHTARGVYPQGYISQIEATRACNAAGKRLCSKSEFAEFCRGPNPVGNYYPYGGTTKIPGACNEGKGSSMTRFFGMDSKKWTYAEFNDPILNEWDGGLAQTGAYPQCVSPWGVADCVGNLHEWGSDPPDDAGDGKFRGGFYGDAEANGHGCLYVTHLHAPSYHDYSTGFRCCADVK
jgi:formylglycine-generating enzyme required for sulfatase activity